MICAQNAFYIFFFLEMSKPIIFRGTTSLAALRSMQVDAETIRDFILKQQKEIDFLLQLTEKQKAELRKTHQIISDLKLENERQQKMLEEDFSD